MQWVAVYLTDDGADVVGPFHREHEAVHHVISGYINEHADDPVTGQARYDESSTEWVVPLRHPNSRRGAPQKDLPTVAEIVGMLQQRVDAGDAYPLEDPKHDDHHDTLSTIWDNREGK